MFLFYKRLGIVGHFSVAVPDPHSISVLQIKNRVPTSKMFDV
jgi:hypothetical protein